MRDLAVCPSLRDATALKPDAGLRNGEGSPDGAGKNLLSTCICQASAVQSPDHKRSPSVLGLAMGVELARLRLSGRMCLICVWVGSDGGSPAIQEVT
jgi:hypothetical protein